MSVVIATRNRADELLGTLARLERLPERPPVLVVDNASGDGTAAAVARRFPRVRVIRLPDNRGAAARNAGVERAHTPYVALSDDDSWWEPGALRRAAELFDRHARLGLLAARVLVGRDDRLDPACAAMRDSPLPAEACLPGPPVLGFLACGAVVRRAAFLGVGGFDPRLLLGGEERLLAIDLAAAGWWLAYADELVAHHHPSARRDSGQRRRLVARNDLWVSWLRRPLPGACADTLRLARRAATDPDARAALLCAARGAPWVLAERRVAPRRVERDLRRLRSEP